MAGANETYTIDIQAAIPEGDNVSAKLDAMSKSLLGANDSAEYLDAAIREVSKAMAVAKAATADADNALEEGNAQWAELSANATRAAKALERATLKGKIPAKVADEAEASKKALDAYAISLEVLEKNAAHAATSEQALAAFMIRARDAAKDASAPGDAAKAQAQHLGDLRGSIQNLPGPLGKLTSATLAPAQAFAKLSGSIGKSRAIALLSVAAFAAVTVAVVALTVAIVTSAVKIAAWGVSLADSNRNAALATEAMEAMHPELKALGPTIAAVSEETGAHADELQELAGRLQEAGVAAQDMPKALRAAALAGAALGKGGADDFVASIKEAKGAVGDLADETTSKLGGIVARQMLGLDAQSERFSRNIDGLFGGLNIEPVLEGMRTLVALFDRNTAAGEAIAFLFESIFQPLIDQAKEAAVVIEAFALGFLIGLVKLYIAAKPYIKAIQEFFGFEDTGLTDTLAYAKAAGEALAPILAAIAVVLAGTLAVAIGAQVALWYGLVKAIQFVVDVVKIAAVLVFGPIYAALNAVSQALTGLDVVTLGKNIVLGLAKGVWSAAGAVLGAITGVVGGAISAAKRMLGISSPSKVFMGIGEDTGEGFTGGVEDSTDAAHAAVATLASPTEAMDQAAMSGDVAALERLQGLDAAAAPAPASAPAAPSAGGADAAAGARTVTLYNPVIQLGPGAPKEQAIEFVTWITELLEGDAAQAAGA